MQQNRANGGIASPLVIRFGALGDMVILTALIRTLHARFGSRVDLVLTERHLRPLLEAQPWIGTLYCVSTRKIPYRLNPQLWQLTARLRARGTGPVWVMDRLLRMSRATPRALSPSMPTSIGSCGSNAC
jgi:heptosyltransferase-2/heptosyltransferase-3